MYQESSFLKIFKFSSVDSKATQKDMERFEVYGLFNLCTP